MFRNIMLVLFTALFCACVALLLPAKADSGRSSKVFYQWTTIDGGFAMTDEAKHIPAMYQEAAVTRRFSDVEKEAKVTEMAILTADHRASLEESIKRGQRVAGRNTSNPAPADDCTGFAVTQERRDHEERGHSFNSLFYIVKDLCGNVKSVTRSNPFPYFEIN